jgi:YidC/Oxa1 family membrane protein insertase
MQGPGGAGGGGGDLRSLMMFVFLALAAVLAFQYFRPQPSAPADNSAQQQPQQAQPATPAGGSGAPVASAAPASSPATLPGLAASAETETTVENELYKIVFTNRGGVVKHWILKGAQYTETAGRAGKQLDLVNSQTLGYGLPLSLYTNQPDLDEQLNKAALYQVTVSGGQSAGGTVFAPGSISFHYSAGGLDVVKTFRFDSTYVVAAEIAVKRNGSPVRALLSWPNGLGDQIDALQYAGGKIIWAVNGKDDSTDGKKVVNNSSTDAPYQWAAVSDLYFAAAFMPDSPERATAVTLHRTFEAPVDATKPNEEKRVSDVLGLAVGDTSGTTKLRLYVGPKQTDVLKSVHATGASGQPDGPSLEPLIQFGWLTIIAKPLYLAVRFVRDLLGSGANNWGWAIIIVTLVFNLALMPTRFFMMKSSLRMMRIQPKAEAIKRKYAHLKINDPKRTEMNTEMMQLYKDEGVNMYGSCLPLLVQMPLFFAYYRVLQNAVELRHAQWFWLLDLSAPDPLYILPIIIILSMFLVQFITPSPGMDATQRRLMAFMMPVIFGFSMLHFASGLALYWGTGNVINLALQIGINQSSIGREMHEIAARRAAKKGGGPTTLRGKR